MSFLRIAVSMKPKPSGSALVKKNRPGVVSTRLPSGIRTMIGACSETVPASNARSTSCKAPKALPSPLAPSTRSVM